MGRTSAPAVALEWVVPPMCPPRERFEASLDAMVLEAISRPGLAIRITIGEGVAPDERTSGIQASTSGASGGGAAHDPGVTVHVQVDGIPEPVDRVFTASDCGLAVDAAALVVAVALDPAETASAVEPRETQPDATARRDPIQPPAGPPGAGGAGASARRAPLLAASSPQGAGARARPGPRPRGVAIAGLSGPMSATPGWGLIATAGAGLRGRAWSAVGFLQGDMPRVVPVPRESLVAAEVVLPSGAGTRAGALLGGLRACAEPSARGGDRPRVELRPAFCGSAAAGVIFAEGRRLPVERRTSAPSVELGAAVGLLVQADRRLSVGLFLEGLGAPLSTRFRLDGVGQAAATWPASVRLRIEIAVGRR